MLALFSILYRNNDFGTYTTTRSDSLGYPLIVKSMYRNIVYYVCKCPRVLNVLNFNFEVMIFGKFKN